MNNEKMCYCKIFYNEAHRIAVNHQYRSMIVLNITKIETYSLAISGDKLPSPIGGTFQATFFAIFCTIL